VCFLDGIFGFDCGVFGYVVVVVVVVVDDDGDNFDR